MKKVGCDNSLPRSQHLEQFLFQYSIFGIKLDFKTYLDCFSALPTDDVSDLPETKDLKLKELYNYIKAVLAPADSLTSYEVSLAQQIALSTNLKSQKPEIGIAMDNSTPRHAIQEVNYEDDSDVVHWYGGPIIENGHHDYSHYYHTSPVLVQSSDYRARLWYRENMFSLGEHL